MRTAISAIIVSISLLVGATAADAEKIDLSSFTYGNWIGAAFTNDQTKRFSHCGIVTSYTSGDYLHFMINADATISIGVSNPTWNLTVGDTFKLVVQVDR